MRGVSADFSPISTPVSSKVSRMAASARPRARAGEIPFSTLRATSGRSSPPAAMRISHGSMRPPGKHEFVRLERHLGMALAHQHADAVLVAPHDDQRRRILGPERGPRHELLVGVEHLRIGHDSDATGSIAAFASGKDLAPRTPRKRKGCEGGNARVSAQLYYPSSEKILRASRASCLGAFLASFALKNLSA